MEGNPLDQAFYLSLIVGSFLVASLRRVKWSRLFAANIAITLFYLYFAMSVFWSGDPTGSAKRLIKDFGMLFVISVILSEKDPLQAIRAVYVRCACVLLPMSVVFIKYFPNYARAYTVEGDIMFTGVTTQKNSLGEIVLIFSMFLVWDYLERRPKGAKLRLNRIPWDVVVLLLMGMWLLKMSQSKTALVCMLLGLALIVTSSWLASKMISRMVLLGALSVPFLLFFSQQFNSVIAPVIEALGRNMTFTGRTEIWEHITSKTVNPLIGAGYWNFWGGKGGQAIKEALDTGIPSAHCGYLDIYLDGGLLGLVLLFCLLFAAGKRLIRDLHVNRYQRVRFAFLVVVILYNLSESVFARPSPSWFTTLLVLIDFPSRKAEMGSHELGCAVAMGHSVMKQE